MGCSYGAVKGEVSGCGFYCLVVSNKAIFYYDMIEGDMFVLCLWLWSSCRALCHVNIEDD